VLNYKGIITFQQIYDTYLSKYNNEYIFNIDESDGITMKDFNDSLDDLIVGVAKKEKIMSDEEKKIVAYHEVGHAIIGYLMELGDLPIKISIIPSGRNALGYTKHNVDEKYMSSFEEMVSKIYCLLAGRCCELLIFGKIYTGATDDIEKVNTLMNDMIFKYSMYKKHAYITPMKNYISDVTVRKVEQYKIKMINAYAKHVKEILNEFIDDVHSLAKELYNEEVLLADVFEKDGKLKLSDKFYANRSKILVLRDGAND
jgi:ATP-dependent Zn protease